MSSIAKPGAYFTNAVNLNTIVPVEQVLDVVKVDRMANPNGPASTADFQIIFTLMGDNNIVRWQVIHFTTAGARNTSFTNYKSAFAAAVL